MNRGTARKIPSLLYSALIHSAWLLKFPYASKLWWRAWKKGCAAFPGPVTTRIHGRRVVLNFGYPYPLNSRLYPSFNNPLVELAYQSYSAKHSPITVVDVGAAIGDTILLLYSNCPEMIRDFICIDGDPEFFNYLSNNLGHLKEGRLFLNLLSSSDGNERELVRTHLGTASAQGETRVRSRTLDSVIQEANVETLDLLKIDVDGFDGKVLLGAQQVLNKHRPAVIFEWFPTLCRETSNNWTDHFEALLACDYTRFVWFTKYGEFSHFMEGYDKKSIDMLAELVLRNKFHEGWHYDVIALPRSSPISEFDLAELAFAKNRKSPY